MKGFGQVRPVLVVLALFRLGSVLGLSLSQPSSSSSLSSSRLSSNEKALRDSGPFPRTWIPLASVYELDPDRPTPLQFLGQKYVAYQDNAGRWVVLDDACPHRLAPLSEGRVDRITNPDGHLECSYHGWSFNSSGICQKIPQMEASAQPSALKNPRCHVASYSTMIEKNILFAWLWPEDCIEAMLSDDAATRDQEQNNNENNSGVMPQAMLERVQDNCSTYTRDLPYGWDTLLENILDPAHVPFAHHGLQGKREDAIAINMTKPSRITKYGFSFGFDDRTMGMRRSGGAVFRAPYVVQYGAVFEDPPDADQDAPPRFFNLTAVMVPTKPGWSRIMLFGAPLGKPTSEDIAKRESALSKIFRIVPASIVHQFSNRFLDSDLAFLHFQEQERQKRGQVLNPGSEQELLDYFMPAPADRCIVALRKWLREYAHTPGPLPPPITDRDVLFDRWNQHSDQCRHCNAAVKRIQKVRVQTYVTLGVSFLFISHWPAQLVTAACILAIPSLSAVEKSFKTGGFDHYKNQ